MASTADVVGLVAEADLAVVLHEEASAPLASLAVPASGRVVVVVGPEGGLTDDEVAAFTAAGAHVRTARRRGAAYVDRRRRRRLRPARPDPPLALDRCNAVCFRTRGLHRQRQALQLRRRDLDRLTGVC